MVLGETLSIPGFVAVKLWQNASPGSNFGAQTVNVPGLSEYSMMLVYFGSTDSPYPSFSGTCPYGINNGIYVDQTNQGNYYRRYCSITSATQVYFSDGFSGNNRLIPLFIYGIKGALV